jgi:rubrerythrin
MSRTLNDLLDVAILDEINAQKFYMVMREKTNNPKLKDFFSSLAHEKEPHERILKGVKEMGLFDGTIEVDDETIKKIEGAHIIKDQIPVEEMTMEVAMEIAMKREDKASKVYGQIADSSPREEIMKLFTSIAADEKRHFNIIDQHYKMLTGQMGRED